VLVTGPTGPGKSTTLAAMIDFVNQNERGHVLTMEDPLEFVHPDKQCFVTQRQIGSDCTSFREGLRRALRQDPDVILIGEMRDLETISMAITVAETGHLVFGTLHTTSAISTVDRIIDVFPTDAQQQVRVQLAGTLQGVISQTLVARVGGGRGGRIRWAAGAEGQDAGAGEEVVGGSAADGLLLRTADIGSSSGPARPDDAEPDGVSTQPHRVARSLRSAALPPPPASGPAMQPSPAATVLACSCLVAAPSAQGLILDLLPGLTTNEEVLEIRGIAGHGAGLLLAIDQEGSGTEPWWSDGTAAGTFMLKDLASGHRHSGPGASVGLGGHVLFFAADTRLGLWRTDGTAAGTVRLAGPLNLAENVPPVVLGNAAYFLAGGSSGSPRALWRTDGTVNGTTIVAGGLWDGEGLRRVGARLFFRVGSYSLWTSDGTPAGTSFVKAFYNWQQPEEIGPIADVNGRALFAADDGQDGRSLWVSDGTAAGTSILLPADWQAAVGQQIVVLQGRAYFSGDDGVHGNELWSTDGTDVGTNLVVDLTPGPNSSWVSGLFAAPTMGRLFFSAGDSAPVLARELYVSDGTAAGTQLVDLGPGGNLSDPRGFCDGGGKVVFEARDSATGFEPWASFGSTASTWMLGDLYPGTASSSSRWFTAFGGEVVFVAGDATSIGRLWTTDGTPGNTRPLPLPQAMAPLSSNPYLRVNGGGTAWLQTAAPGFPSGLWLSDGTAATTRRLTLTGAASGGALGEMVHCQGTTIAVVGSAPSTTLLRIEDSGSTTLLRAFGSQGEYPRALRATDSLVYFAASHSAFGLEPWCTDGTASGTRMIRDIRTAGSSLESYPEMAAFGDRLVFAADDGVHGVEPWITDGTAAGTFLLADVYPGSSGCDPKWFCDIGGHLLFQARGPANGEAIWRSDGTPAGTFPIMQLAFGMSFSAQLAPLTRVGGLAFFSVYAYGDFELWRTDGTTAGTMRVLRFPSSSPPPDQFVAARGKLFFRGFMPNEDRELWVSDGTTAGTALVKDLRPGFGDGVELLVAAGSAHVVFEGSTPDGGTEVWISDGTAAGTMPLVDVVPGPGSSEPAEFLQAGGRLYWSAYHPDTGRELYGAPLAAFGGAMWEPYGAGCGGAHGIPVAAVDGMPILGSTDMAWTLRRATPSSLTFLLLDLQRRDVALGGGCRALVGPDAFWCMGTTDGGGAARLGMRIPNDQNLAGLHLRGQFAVLEVGGPLGGIGTATQGVHVLIGR